MSSTSRTFLSVAVPLLLICLSVAQAIYYYPILPETVASHFGSSGQADGWMGKRAFLCTTVGAVILVSMVLQGISLVIRVSARAARRKWGQSNNDTASDATDHRGVVHQHLESMSAFSLWFGTTTVAFLLIVFQFAIQANLSPEPVMQHFPIALGLYLAVGLLLVARLVIQQRYLDKLLPPSTLPPNIWFPAKRFGWGWGPPVRWQGWVVIGIWLLALAGGIVFLMRSGWLLILMYPFLILMTLLLIVVCMIKGEKPRWRWGE